MDTNTQVTRLTDHVETYTKNGELVTEIDLTAYPYWALIQTGELLEQLAQRFPTIKIRTSALQMRRSGGVTGDRDSIVLELWGEPLRVPAASVGAEIAVADRIADRGPAMIGVEATRAVLSSGCSRETLLAVRAKWWDRGTAEQFDRVFGETLS